MLMIVDVWRIVVRVRVDGNGTVTRDEVASCLDEIMEKGGELRRNVLKWKDCS